MAQTHLIQTPKHKRAANLEKNSSFEVEGNEGYGKIRYTMPPLTERHDEWSFDCNKSTVVGWQRALPRKHAEAFIT